MNSLGSVNGVVKQNEYNLCEKKEGIMSEMPIDIVGKIFDFAQDVPPMNIVKRSWGECKIFTSGAKEYLPPEIVALICKNLKTQDMNKFLSVNNSLIKYREEPVIAKRLHVAHILQKAKNFIGTEFKRFLVSNFEKNIALLQAVYSIMDCKETVDQIKDPFEKAELFLKIARVDSSYVQEAKLALGQINDAFKKAQILTQMAKIDPDHDVAAATEAAGKINNLCKKAKMLLKIAKIDLRHLNAAKEIVEQIEDSRLKAKMLLKMAKIDPDRDVAAAKEAAGKINNLCKKAEILVEIAKIDPDHDVAAAKEAAGKINNPPLKAEMLLEVAKIDPDRDVTAVKKVLDQIEGSTRWKADNLIEIAKINPNYVTEAKNLVEKIVDNSSWKVRALLKIGEIDTEYVKKAKEFAEKMIDPYSKSQALLMIAKLDASYIAAVKECIKLFKQAENKTENPWMKLQLLQNPEEVKAQSLLQVVKIEALHDLRAAEKTVEEIQTPYAKMEALIVLANAYLMNKS